ncbi:MAG: ethanolamine utilization protein EutJ, partial [Bdellovibrio sp.]
KGIELAVEEVNKSGGIKGRRVRLTSLDDQGKPEEASAATMRLIGRHKILALLGEVASSRSIVMAAIAQKNGTPMITPSSTNPKVTEQGNYVFRTGYVDPFQAEVMEAFARISLKMSKMAVLFDVKSDHSVDLAKAFIDFHQKNGGQVVSRQTFSSGDIDFMAQLTNIRSSQAQAIYIPGYYTEVGLIAKQARQLHFNGPLLGSGGWDSSSLTEVGGHSLNGSYYTCQFFSEEPSEKVKNFVALFRKTYHSDPDGNAATGYDAANVLFEALRSSKSFDRNDIRNAIAQIKDFPGVTGKITFDANRNAIKPATIVKIVGGKQKLESIVNPK